MTPTSVPASAAQEFDDVPLEAIEDRRVEQLRDRHQWMLWLSVTIIIAAFLLRERSTGQVGPALFPSWNLPPLCGSRTLFNAECPGCGLTRSFIALADGDWRASLAANRVGWILALAVVLQIPYRCYSLRELRTRPVDEILTRSWPTWCGYFLIAALLVNWLSRMSHLY